MTKFENIEDKLPLGKTLLKVYSQDVYENGAFVRNKQRTGVSKNGNKYWFYNTPDVMTSPNDKGKQYRMKILVFTEKDKGLFDSGYVEANVTELDDIFDKDENGNPYQIDGKFVKKKKIYWNPTTKEQYEAEQGVPRETIDTKEAEQILDGEAVDDINIEDIPF